MFTQTFSSFVLLFGLACIYFGSLGWCLLISRWLSYGDQQRAARTERLRTAAQRKATRKVVREAVTRVYLEQQELLWESVVEQGKFEFDFALRVLQEEADAAPSGVWVPRAVECVVDSPVEDKPKKQRARKSKK